jgi:hypothetical protein
MVLQPINQQLKEHLQQWHEISPPTTTLSYHDDNSVVLPAYEDIPWFLETFQTLCNLVGIKLNLHKT